MQLLVNFDIVFFIHLQRGNFVCYACSSFKIKMLLMLVAIKSLIVNFFRTID